MRCARRFRTNRPLHRSRAWGRTTIDGVTIRCPAIERHGNQSRLRSALPAELPERSGCGNRTHLSRIMSPLSTTSAPTRSAAPRARTPSRLSKSQEPVQSGASGMAHWWAAKDSNLVLRGKSPQHLPGHARGPRAERVGVEPTRPCGPSRFRGGARHPSGGLPMRTPDRIRTCIPRLRKPLLRPLELQGREWATTESNRATPTYQIGLVTG